LKYKKHLIRAKGRMLLLLKQIPVKNFALILTTYFI